MSGMPSPNDDNDNRLTACLPTSKPTPNPVSKRNVSKGYTCAIETEASDKGRKWKGNQVYVVGQK